MRGIQYAAAYPRHCKRNEAIHLCGIKKEWIASSGLYVFLLVGPKDKERAQKAARTEQKDDELQPLRERSGF